MTDIVQKERQRLARSRAGRIRFGMQNYIETLGVIAQARAAEDHIALGYDSWAEYVDKEFGEGRLQLPPEMLMKAITELRLAGASQREIAHTVGVSTSKVNRALSTPAVPNETDESDTHRDSPAESPLVDAMKQAINDAEERAEDHRDWSPGDEDASASVADHGSPESASEESAGPGSVAALPGPPNLPGEESGSVTSPTDPDLDEWQDGFEIALNEARNVMRTPPERVAEWATERQIEELFEFAARLADYAEQVSKHR